MEHGGHQKPATEYTYPQLPIQKAATRPGSILDRQGGSNFNRRGHQALKKFILGHAVVHADETPVALLAPGRGRTRRAYVWVYRTTNFVAQRAVLFDFCASRASEHPQRMLSRPLAEELHAWLLAQRQALAKADVTAKAIDYRLSHWRAHALPR